MLTHYAYSGESPALYIYVVLLIHFPISISNQVENMLINQQTNFKWMQN